MTEKDLFSSPEEEVNSEGAAVPEASDTQPAVVSEESSDDGQISLFEENVPQKEIQIPLWDESSAEASKMESFTVSSEQIVIQKPAEVPELIISSAENSQKEISIPSTLSFLDDFDEESFYTPVDQIPRRRRRFKEEDLSDVPQIFEGEETQETFSEDSFDEIQLVSEAPEVDEGFPEKELPEEFSSVPFVDSVAETESVVDEVLPSPKKKAGKKPGSAVSPLVEFVEIIVGALVAAILVLTLICRTGVVEGGSMLPTMHGGDRYIISDLFYTPEAGDIVVFRPEIEGEDELWIKRVIAVEGQTVYIDPDTYQVYVDNQLLDEPYLNGLGTIPHTTPNPITVPEGCVYVMGDNRAISHDSRYEDLGCVEVRQLAGRVILRFWPLNSFGFCE